MKKAIKPKLYDLCSCGYELMYECGKCKYTFNMAHICFDYCPHCGNKIDWGVVIECNEEWKNDYLDGDIEKQKEFEIRSGSRCPYCGADYWWISARTTLVYGPNNTTTYHCSSCGKEWTDKDFASEEVLSR